MTLFKMTLSAGVTLIRFVNDVGMTTVARTKGVLIASAKLVPGKWENWRKTKHLEMAPQKFKAIRTERRK